MKLTSLAQSQKHQASYHTHQGKKPIKVGSKILKQLSTTDTPHFSFDGFFHDRRSIVALFPTTVSPPPTQVSKTLTSSHLFS